MSHDTLVHGLVRPLIRPLVRTRVTPDHLTVFRFATGLLAACLFAAGRPVWVDGGAVVFLLSAFLDRADGELARQSGRFSCHGHRWDLLADCSAGALCFVGLGVGARAGWLGLWAPVLGVLAGTAVAALFWAINVRRSGHLPRLAQGDRTLVDPDDAMFLVPVIIWVWGPAVVLLPAGTVTPLLAALLLVRRGG